MDILTSLGLSSLLIAALGVALRMYLGTKLKQINDHYQVSLQRDLEIHKNKLAIEKDLLIKEVEKNNILELEKIRLSNQSQIAAINNQIKVLSEKRLDIIIDLNSKLNSMMDKMQNYLAAFRPTGTPDLNSQIGEFMVAYNELIKFINDHEVLLPSDVYSEIYDFAKKHQFAYYDNEWRYNNNTNQMKMEDWKQVSEMLNTIFPSISNRIKMNLRSLIGVQ